MVVLFVGAFALAFVPHGVVQADRGVAAARDGSSTTPAAMDMPAQPADAPAVTDWPAYGRSNAAQRYSPLTAINRDNVDGLERAWRSEEHTSELQSLMRISYAVFCLEKKMQ